MNYKEKIDYSSLSTYLDCPRKFLFQYILNLRSPFPSIHLVFGACYHYGLETVYRHLKDDPDSLTVIDATELSIVSFNDLWQLEGAMHWPDQDAIFPKSPGHAANMYHEYWNQRLKLDQEDRIILAVEAPFTIDLSKFYVGLPNYIGRLDLVFELVSGNIEIVDHKTAKALYQTSLITYEMSMQTDGYLTAGHLYYDKIPTMVYNVHLCQKSKIAFHRFEIHKRKQQIEQFLQDLIAHTADLQTDLERYYNDLETFHNRNDHITSFRRRPGYACTTYMTPCPYLDLCKMRNNPLGWLHNPPQGYIIKEWDPETHEQELKDKLKELN